MKKAVKIVLGVLGALGLGLVGLILACHFKPGLSDAIAEKLYKNRDRSAEESALSEEEEEELDNLSLEDLTGEEGDTDPALTALLPPDEPGETELPVQPEENAEPEAPAEPPKSLEDYGLTQEDVLNNIQEYYDDCYDQLSAAKGEDTSFYDVVRDSMLAQEVLRSYDTEAYRSGFMNRFMDDYHVDTCGWSMNQEELQGGYILISHTFTR